MEELQRIVTRAWETGRAAAASGRVANYIPELGKADPSSVAVAVANLDGSGASAGDVETRFTLQSVSKVASLACVMATGLHDPFERVGVEPSGDAFHSIVRLEEETGRPRNPLINAGAIAVSELLEGPNPSEKIETLRGFLQVATRGADVDGSFALDEAIYHSERDTGYRNRALASYMKHHDVVADPFVAVDTYFRQCSLLADVRSLARFGLFLASGGVDPDSGLRILSAEATRKILALMTTCGLYDEVGRFALQVGIPAKSGVSGAILAIVPGRCAMACFGPALGPKGNSVAGMAMMELLARELELSIFSAGEAGRQLETSGQSA